VRIIEEEGARPSLAVKIGGRELITRLDPFDRAEFRARLARISQKDALIRAAGLKPGKPATVIDMCGGTGADAIIMAAYGAHVACCERHPIVMKMLEHTLQAMGERIEHADVARRILPVKGDALESCPPARFDAAHIAAMFHKTGSARAHKDMQCLQALTDGEESGLEALLAAAFRLAPRIAVKRAAHAPALGAPNFSLPGKAVRYDVYARRA